MAIRGIVFDIGGVLEYTPDLGVMAEWERKLELEPGEMGARLGDVWEGGSIGTISEADVYRAVGERLGMSELLLNEMMDEMWREYLGTLNVELTDYFRGLRPRFQTAILSNSFVGAREREQAHYQFEECCDFIIYSHEVGLAKPDSRIYALTCERLGLEPGEVVFVDDAEANIDGARAFGMHGI
ncbi:MAG: HAD family phosphatase, partial [Candidatus Promineifilaceae bacterium]